MLLNEDLKEKMDAAIVADQGDTFRYNLQQILPKMSDIYYQQGSKEYESPTMRASMIGSNCPRKIWYHFRDAKDSEFTARVLRVFNRGHMEEARIIAMLQTIGAVVRYQNEIPRFKQSVFTGSCDGIASNVPGYREDVMLEFKTMNKTQYAKYLKEGVRVFNTQYYVQTQFYLTAYHLDLCLFIAVCKDNDDFSIEEVKSDRPTIHQYYDRTMKIVNSEEPPMKISESPIWWECRYCNYHGICHEGQSVKRTCRTCTNVKVDEDGIWACGKNPRLTAVLSTEEQRKGCEDYNAI